MNLRSSAVGVVAGLVCVAAGTAALLPFRTGVSRATPALVFVVPVVVAGLLGRRVAAVVTALVAAGVYSFSFVPPYEHVSISQPEDIVAAVVFMVVAVVVGTLVAVEADRRDAAERRSDEIRRLMAEREQLREEANRVELVSKLAEQRSALLRSVSHDLRTPLSTIEAVATDLRDGTSYPDETRDRLLDLVSDEATRLNRIVANLLSMSRIETGSFAPERQAVALDELLADRVGRLDRVLAGRAVETRLAADLPLLDADYSQLDQVITNLLENAARHTPPGATITIRGESTGAMVHVTVSDDGPGIPADFRERLFEPFESRSSSTGLGLALCRAIIEAHGGVIAVEPSERGATIGFTVPVHA